MTLALAVVSADGVVFAADSRTTHAIGGGQAPMRVLSDFTHKVFQVGNFAVATYGWAFILERNIAGHMAEFSQMPVDGETPDAFVERLVSFFGDRFDEHIAQGLDDAPPAGLDQLGFFIGAFADGVGKTYEVSLPSRRTAELHSTTNPGAAWRGQTDVVVRIIKGADLDLLTVDAQTAGLAAEHAKLEPVLSGLEYIIPFNAMNLQDAIDFAVFAIRTTIDVQRLTYGTSGHAIEGSWPGVGGPIEIATLTASQGFEWVQRTEPQGERPAGEPERL